MSDYTPVYVPGKVLTFTASGAVSGGDLLVVSGSGAVAKLAFGASPQVIIGVAHGDAQANERVSVFGRGIVHESVPHGTVTAGDLLTTPVAGDTAGAQVKTVPAVTTPTSADVVATRSIFGIALTTATYPAKVRWMEI